jgi:vacuolar-type H+-ATPase subunit I/STV1
MAKDKRSFLLYTDLIHTVNKLSDATAGALFKHILKYVNDEDPETDDLVIQIAFEPIKQSLKRDLKRWEEIKEKRSEAGRASAEARKKKKEDREEKERLAKLEEDLLQEAYEEQELERLGFNKDLLKDNNLTDVNKPQQIQP